MSGHFKMSTTETKDSTEQTNVEEVDFSSLGVNDNVVQALADMEIADPSDIQKKVLPLLFQKKNVIAEAPCGSGKTIAFLAGIISAIDPNVQEIQAVYLAPTRELVLQTREVFDLVNKYSKLQNGVVVGPDSILKGHPHFLFGTAASVAKLYKGKKIPFDKCKFLILDEADELICAKSHRLSTLFLIKELRAIGAQFGFFSATFSQTATKQLTNAAGEITQVDVKAEKSTIQHWYTTISAGDPDKQREEGIQALLELNKVISTGQIYIFANRKDEVKLISEKLNEGKFECKGFSGDLTAAERDAIISEFRKETIKVLVATDVLQRGIDIPNTYLVVNWGFPCCKGKGTNISDSYSYIHRSGRAGRFGRSGICLSLIFNEEQEKYLKDVISKRPDIQELKKIDWHKFDELPKEQL